MQSLRPIRQRNRETQSDEDHVIMHPAEPTVPRRRSLSIPAEDTSPPASEGASPGDSNSRLLSLPPELRIQIWQRVLAGYRIALYHEESRLTHCLLDSSNTRTPGGLIALSLDSIVKEIVQYNPKTHQPARSYRWDSLKCPPIPEKLKVIPFLQTCRQIYAEAIEYLYSSNVFVCLQNSTLRALQCSMLPHRFAQIRSLHLHHHILEKNYHDWPFTALDGLQIYQTFMILLNNLPNLKHLSVFIQGPLIRWTSYEFLLHHLEKVAKEVGTKIIYIRLPWPLRDPARPHEVEAVLKGLDAAREDPAPPLRIFLPPVPSGRNHYEMADANLATWGAGGWRVGSMFAPSDEGGDGYVATNYAAYAPF